jgi:PPOX class probable F420-dependent enzyme
VPTWTFTLSGAAAELAFPGYFIVRAAEDHARAGAYGTMAGASDGQEVDVRLDQAQARQRFLSASVARLATVGSDGAPRMVPVVFALITLEGGEALVHAVDQKPKSTKDLARLRDITAEPRVALLADEYDDDWSRLWWARADATARILDRDEDMDDGERAIDALAERYPQYRAMRPSGLVVAAKIHRWSGWSAS